ncbi:MAG: hypothetical protein K0R81_1639, partial [Microbacterium sp.]|nr:hypothetical protein [Microbacterium sp.]
RGEPGRLLRVMGSPSPFDGSTVAFGTVHGKEAAFAPAFRRWLGAQVVATVALDTDALGTFTRDVPRVLAPEEAAAAKAHGAAAELGTATAVATEASYSPALGGFGPMVHEELAVFVDLERGIRVRHAIRQHVHVAPPRVVRTGTPAHAAAPVVAARGATHLRVPGVRVPRIRAGRRRARGAVRGLRERDIAGAFRRRRVPPLPGAAKASAIDGGG